MLAHSDVAPARKEDPGELFPWERLAAAGIGLWPDKEESPLPLREGARGRGSFEQNLRRFGYGIAPEADASLEQVITAFQRHWRQSDVNGIADAECDTILRTLVDALD